MQFKDLKSDNSLYILNRKSVELTQGRVLNVSNPHYDSKFSSSIQVVDVVVEAEGRNITYTFQHDAENGYVDNLILTTNRDTIIRELEMLKEYSDKEIEKMPTYQANSEKCSKILAEFDPRVKEKQENNRRLDEVEASVKEMRDMFREFIEEFKK